MLVLRQARQAIDPRRGRHAIRRERSFAEVLRLRHAQIVLARGIHRTRVSEMRPSRVRSALAARHPFRSLERTSLARRPVTG